MHHGDRPQNVLQDKGEGNSLVCVCVGVFNQNICHEVFFISYCIASVRKVCKESSQYQLSSVSSSTSGISGKRKTGKSKQRLRFALNSG